MAENPEILSPDMLDGRLSEETDPTLRAAEMAGAVALAHAEQTEHSLEAENNSRSTVLGTSLDHTRNIVILEPDITASKVTYKSVTNDSTNVIKKRRIEDYIQAAQLRIMEIPGDSEGLNMDRVQDFVEGLGLRFVPPVPVKEENKPALLKTFAEIGLDTRSENRGIYLDEVDVAVIYRNSEAEELNGPELTESFAVHEATHASHKHSTIRAISDGTTLNIKSVRIGQAVNRQLPKEHDALDTVSGSSKEHFTGLFWEEALAEQVRGTYVKEILGKPGGFSDITEEIIKECSRCDQDNQPVPVSSKYVYKSSEDRLTFVDAAYAAAALDQLAQRDPELIHSFLRARNDADGLREVAQRINNIVPGLYETIRDGYNHEDLFNAGASYVVKALSEKDEIEITER